MRFRLPLALVALTLTACLDLGDSFLYPLITEPQPMWLWSGRHGDAAPCPEGRTIRWQGWVDEEFPPECGPCACSPARCVLPAGITTHAAACPDEGPPSSFEADEVHDAACIVPAPPLPESSLASVTYPPPTFAPCTPSPTPEPPPIDGIFARACQAGQEKDMPPPGWSFCLPPEDDGTCRPEFPIRREFRTPGPDHRTCSPCECGPPSGGTCSTRITLYGDTGCTRPFDSAELSDTDVPLCQDIRATAELAAFRVDVIRREEGACTPKRATSMASGTVEEGEQHVACCRE
ncbi:hypothetical protein predicted by Glimmer/Critica [Sorangium cellulosum So ce56]|uniref:Uncharacterized protein n=1 Tax=Sorangium cellulosum (strain So ce56) TaxID=448385 RepID=A9F6M0_SORC5|nr:hypothetical protein predicted by Glimmer/Critica [Sorangium cellulosum So ce56]